MSQPRPLLVFCLFLLLLPHALALQASPAQHTLYTPDGAAHYSITVTNDEDRAMTVTFTPTGPFATLIDAPPQATLAAGEKQSFAVAVAVPADIQPGTLDGGILIESHAAGTGTVSANAAVLHKVRLVTPQQGTYLSGELIAANNAAGTPSAVTLVLHNTGTEPVAAAVELSLDGQQLTAKTVTLDAGAVENVVGSWTPAAAGQYTLRATVRYAGKDLALNRTVTVGDLSVAIRDVSFGSFVLGKPFRVSVLAKTAWGEPLPVTASVALQQGTVLQSALGVPTQFGPGEEKQLPVFLESTGLHDGAATLRVQLTYAGQQQTAVLPVYIGENTITFQPPQTAPPASSARVWLWRGLALLLAAAIIFIMWRLSSKKKGVQ